MAIRTTLRRLPLTQFAVTLGVLAAVILMPPADGRMTLLPLTGGGSAIVVNLAIAHGGRIAGSTAAGRVLVVEGSRARLAGPLLARGIIPVAAFGKVCGA